MKTKIALLLTFVFLGWGAATAQNEDLNTLSIMTEYAKSKNYDAAYKPFMELRERNPKYHRGIYKYGEDILEHKIENTTGAEQVAYINDMIKLWDERALHFSANTPKGEYGAKACQLMYDYRKELNKSSDELYKCFDDAYKADPKTFTNPKSLYTYFSLMVDLYDAGNKQPAELFNKYDDVVEKVESEVENYSNKLNKLIEKEDAGTALTSKDKSYKKYYESYLKAYDQISGSIDSKLGERANCENLIPLYTRDFEANKNDAVWLQRAMGKMYQKECTDDPLFVKIVEQKNTIDPDSNTAFYVGILKDKAGQSSEALKYYEQALKLETDNFKKAKLYSKIASKLKAKGSYAKARSYYREALKLNPSNGRPHLAIASMYASSANSCGDTNFNKRAVFWLAAIEAEKAGRVDPTLKSAAAQSATSYRAKAPQKSEIFSEGNAGQTINIGCWIGASVKVPTI